MPSRLKRLVRVTCLAGLLFPWPAAAAAPASSRWLTPAIQTEEGLPNNTVGGLAQTPDGYLWLGTPTGLARFDGDQFQEFSSTNFVDAPNRGILTMVRSRDGGLRLAMDRGAIVFLNTDGVSALVPPRDDVPDEFPFSLVEDGDGALWVSYRAGSVCRISGRTVTRFTEADGLPAAGAMAAPEAMCALGRDVHGGVWFVQAGRFGRFQNGRFSVLRQLPALPARLAMCRAGGIWICSGSRLFKYDETGEWKDLGELSQKAGDIEPTALLEDRDGRVWIGTAYSGLFHFDGSGFESLPINQVLSLLEDGEGNLWVGTTGGGLHQVRRRAVELEGTQAGLPFEAVQSLCEDSTGTMWAATQNGSLARRVDGQWQVFVPEPGWAAEATCVTADPSGRIWIGTRQHGLFCWKDGRLVDWGNRSELKGRTIHTLQFSRSGDLWIGEDTPNTVQRLHDGKLTTLNAPSEDLRVIRAMAEDAGGTIWVATSRGLLLRVEGDRLIDETARTTGSPTSVRCLSTTPDGSLWIGYAGWGVGRLKGGHFARINSERGLFDDYISHIVADGQGWLWFGGDLGIFKVRQRELDDAAADRGARVRSIHYGKGEGLPSLQATFGGAPAALRSRDGRIWIPTRTGLTVIDPERLREHANAPPPPVVLHRVTVDEHLAALNSGVVPDPGIRRREIMDLRRHDGALRVSPGHHRVEFDFTALSLTAPENVHFRYRLSGFDEDWSSPQPVRSATYSLSAGKYEFRVIACNSDGVWNETGDSLALIVAPFFWQTWTFRGVGLGVFTLSLIAIVRYVSFRHLRQEMRRLEQQAALHKERARIAKDIHDDVGANLTQIALLGELARQDREVPDKSFGHVAQMSSTARQAVKSLDEIVWAVNPQNDTLAHLIDYTGQYALDYLRLAGVRCRLDLPEQTPPREVSTDVRHNLFLVIKEALNNIIKHARATEVWLRVQVSDGGLQIAIEDNGCGFDHPSGDTEAYGLRNMRHRLHDVGGECRIESRTGGGTRVIIEFPWPPVSD